MMAIDLQNLLHTCRDLEKTVRMIEEMKTVAWSDSPFTLKSGIQSRVYVYGREDVTDHPVYSQALGQEVSRRAWGLLGNEARGKRLCAIGIPTAGTALAAATAHAGFNCCYRIMREEQKGYGAHKKTWVNGRPDSSLHVYFTVDNVITDGQSKIEAIERLREDGYPAFDMLHLTLIDRQQGGIERLRGLGFRAEAVFNLLDLVWAFGELGLWNLEQVRAVEDEIGAHRALL